MHHSQNMILVHYQDTGIVKSQRKLNFRFSGWEELWGSRDTPSLCYLGRQSRKAAPVSTHKGVPRTIKPMAASRQWWIRVPTVHRDFWLPLWSASGQPRPMAWLQGLQVGQCRWHTNIHLPAASRPRAASSNFPPAVFHCNVARSLPQVLLWGEGSCKPAFGLPAPLSPSMNQHRLGQCKHCQQQPLLLSLDHTSITKSGKTQGGSLEGSVPRYFLRMPSQNEARVSQYSMACSLPTPIRRSEES